MTTNQSNSTTSIIPSLVSLVIIAATAAGAAATGWYLCRQQQQQQRTKKHKRLSLLLESCSSSTASNSDNDEDSLTARDDQEEEPIHSVLQHFASLQLAPETTVEEANKRRTATYYLKAREAHAREIVRGIGSYYKLLQLRKDHVEKTLRYSNMGTHSHRTVVVMCDASTSSLLDEARRSILGPLQYAHDTRTRGVWIPALDFIPAADMHVTVAIPWWWHSMREGNYQLSQELAARFRQTLFLKFHHSFQIELQSIVLLGGQTLVALWRCVGERVTEEGHVVYDRHGECVDPFVRLRVEIVRCFTKESSDNRLKPLTYQDVIQQKLLGDNSTNNNSNNNSAATTTNGTISQSTSSLPPVVTSPSATSNTGRPTLTREHSIELKTPGLGSGDGFIHTTLCRLPLDCLSSDDVSLAHVHRLCRELTSTMSGHRMVISKFRFLETTGRGGQSNPCVEPIFDETIEAPTRFKLKRNGNVNEIANLHVMPTESSSGSNRTIGAIRNHVSHKSLAGLFHVPVGEEKLDEMKQSLSPGESGTMSISDGDNDSVRVEITAPVLI